MTIVSNTDDLRPLTRTTDLSFSELVHTLSSVIGQSVELLLQADARLRVEHAELVAKQQELKANSMGQVDVASSSSFSDPRPQKLVQDEGEPLRSRQISAGTSTPVTQIDAWEADKGSEEKQTPVAQGIPVKDAFASEPVSSAGQSQSAKTASRLSSEPTHSPADLQATLPRTSAAAPRHVPMWLSASTSASTGSSSTTQPSTGQWQSNSSSRARVPGWLSAAREQTSLTAAVDSNASVQASLPNTTQPVDSNSVQSPNTANRAAQSEERPPTASNAANGGSQS